MLKFQKQGGAYRVIYFVNNRLQESKNFTKEKVTPRLHQRRFPFKYGMTCPPLFPKSQKFLNFTLKIGDSTANKPLTTNY